MMSQVCARFFTYFCKFLEYFYFIASFILSYLTCTTALVSYFYSYIPVSYTHLTLPTILRV